MKNRKKNITYFCYDPSVCKRYRDVYFLNLTSDRPKNLKKEKKLAQYGDELRPTCVEVRGSLNFSLNPTLMYKYLICLCLRCFLVHMDTLLSMKILSIA